MKRLLVTLDGSAESEAIIPIAVQLAEAAALEVHLLRIAEIPRTRPVSTAPEVDPYRARYREPLLASALPQSGPRPVESRNQAVERAEHEALEYLEDRARAFVGPNVHLHARLDGNAGAAIIDEAKELGIDLIAMATHGRGAIASLVQGSVSLEVVRSGVAPVVLVRPAVLRE